MPKKQLNFEASLARLEEILRALESGDASLDEMLKLYEEGVGLIRFCNEKLESAEQSVKMLQLQSDGSVGLTDFGRTED
jgi:exodeoxyribonuclease VII small subunit